MYLCVIFLLLCYVTILTPLYVCPLNLQTINYTHLYEYRYKAENGSLREVEMVRELVNYGFCLDFRGLVLYTVVVIFH